MPPSKKTKSLAATLQNLTGQFNATFPNSSDPGGSAFSRAPYSSQNIRSLVLQGYDYLDFDSNSGEITTNGVNTSNRRTLRITMESDITSGTHTFSHTVSGKILAVDYGEMEKTGNSFNLSMFSADEATLELEISADGRRYTAKRFDIKVTTTSGAPLDIKADFDIYLTFA
jgi:hypothetical protein